MNWIDFLGLKSPFFLRAALSAVGCSLCTSVIGNYIVYRKLSNIAGAISHGLIAGLGLGIYLHQVHNIQWISPGITCFGFSIFTGLLLALSGKKNTANQEAMATAIWVSGSAIGLILLSKTPSSGQALSRYMLGNILWVSNSQIKQLFALNFLVIFFAFLFHKQILCRIVDEDLAFFQGIPIKKLDFLLMALVSVTVSILTIIFGGLLVMSFLHLPALSAGKICRRNILSSMICTLCISLSSSIIGLLISLHTNTPPTASTSLLLAVIYGLSQIYSRWKTR